MNIKKWLAFGMSMTVLIVIIILNRTMKDLPQWIIYILLGIALLLMLVYFLETRKEEKKKKEKAEAEQKNLKKELISILEEKSCLSPTASVMYKILTNQIIEIQALIQKKDLNIQSDHDEEEDYYEIMLSSKHKKKKEEFYLSLSFMEDEEELLLNSGEEIKVGQMTEARIIDLIIEDINKFE